MIWLIVRDSDRAIMGTEIQGDIEGWDLSLFTIYLWNGNPLPIHDPGDTPPVESFFTEEMAQASLKYTGDRLLTLSDWATIPPGKGGPSSGTVNEWNEYRRDIQDVTDIWNPVWPTEPSGGREPIVP